MKTRPDSLFRTLWLSAGLPMTLVLILVVAWLSSHVWTSYLDDRGRVMDEVNQQIRSTQGFTGGRLDEVESIRNERLSRLNRELFKELGLAGAILVLGIAVPIMVSRHVANLLVRNLGLLEQHFDRAGAKQSALMPYTFDFKEFEGVLKAMYRSMRQSYDAQQRWRLAEKQLVSTNADLVRRAEELKQGRKIALSMMEDAEKAREALELSNAKLSQVIEHARSSVQQAAHASQAKSDFLATMSHEIRTPLNGVIGFIDMLAETPLNEEQQEYMDNLRSSGEALMALINSILDFSKIESGHLDLESREFNLVRMLRDTMGMFFNQASKKGIELKLEIDEDVPRVVAGDETRLRQILTNLLGNAVKFTTEGQVHLQLSCIWMPNRPGECELEFEIRDTGIGMDEEQLTTVFEPFSQADSSTTRKYGGTGLGLTISKRLAEAMGGKLWATSTPGEGSSFFIQVWVRAEYEAVCGGHRESSGAAGEPTLIPLPEPQSEGTAGGASASAAKAAAPLRLNIVVAEDNLANQRLVQLMLKRLGWEASFLSNGQELIEHLKTHPCDLILMDLQMPVVNGVEATALIRQGEAGEAMKDVKIIALTANAMTGEEARCLEAGMDSYLSKPIKISQLESKVRSLFDGVS